MSQVSVTINGRQFRLACEVGQEPHLRRLAADLDYRINRLRASFGDIGDTRLMVMAALSAMDEVVEAASRLRRMEGDLASLRDARAASSERTDTNEAAVCAALNAAAERMESIARRLNQTVSDGGVAMG